jgi:hypothetical protein
MRVLQSVIIGLFLILSFNAFAQDLDTYQWKNRIILLKEPNLESDWLKAQVKRLQSDIGALNERQLVILIISNGVVYDIEQNVTDLNAEKIQSQYGLSDFQGLALIGKDGGVKMKEPFIVNPKTIFELIDSMPMRQSETKKGL